MAFDPQDSLVPLLGVAPAAGPGLIMGRLTAFNSTTLANTVTVLSQDRTDLPLLAPAIATLTAPCTVLLIPFGPAYIIAGRIRVP